MENGVNKNRIKRATHDLVIKQIIEENVKKVLLYEGLLYSYPPAVIFTNLKQNGYTQNEIHYDGEVIIIEFKLSDSLEENKEKYNKLNNKMDNSFGWKHGATIIDGKVLMNKTDFLSLNSGIADLQFEKKFDEMIFKNPSELYHITSKKNLTKILKIGLVPKESDKKFSYNNRIYLSTKIEPLRSLIKKKIENEIIKFNKDYDNKFIILRVKINDGFSLLKDPNFTGGLYTLENIPPNLITPIEEIEINEKGEITNITKLK